MKIYDDQLIIITGGAGFIGSCLIRYLNETRKLHNIIVVDSLGYSGKWKNLVGKKFLDFIHKDDLFDWLKGKERSIEAFIHLGACTNTVEIHNDYLLRNNYQFSVKLADYALENNHRFIYASSAATYGNGHKGFSDDQDVLEQLHPMNMYGYSKHLFDLWLKYQGALNKVVGLKFFNVFGPNEEHKGRMASTITHFVKSIQKEGAIRLFKSTEPEAYADGEQKRDFAYVKNVVQMINAFLTNDATGIYNISSGEATSWNTLAKLVFKAMGEKENIEYIEMPQDLKGKYQNYTCADMSKTQKTLGKIATCMPLEEAVIDYVRHYLLPQKNW